jgi:ATP-dependent helicase/nuclease subunit B
MVALGTFRPAHAGVAFGDGKRLPAYSIATPCGAEVRLGGQIDRVDVVSDGADAGAVAVFDYKLSGGPLQVGSVVYGLSLQLLTSLLVLEASGKDLGGRPVVPAAAFYLQLLRGLQQVDHPDEAVDPDSVEFRLRHKPRGLFDSRFLQALDAAATPGQSSKVVNAYVRKDGQIGNPDRSDAADAQAFTALLSFVRTRLGQIADEVMAGRIDAAPYRIGKVTPCPRCEYRPVCRFEPMVNGYRHLVPLKRSDALDRASGRTQGGRDG